MKDVFAVVAVVAVVAVLVGFAGCSSTGEAFRGDSKDGSRLVISSLATCGNGIKESGEQCDDGNTIRNDGCTKCKFSCSESDSGDSLGRRGSIVGYNATNPSSLTRWQDWCHAGKIYEYYCSGGLAAEREVSCPSGQSCTDGRCA